MPSFDAPEHMAIWKAVCETYPGQTKKVSYGKSERRREFTAIDAYSQIQRATGLFGPVAKGWGWDVEWETIHAGDGESTSILVVAHLTVWYERPEQRIRVASAKTLYSQGRWDEDAHKKAITDALTKALSYLGFNADVFLGLWDDHKYVASQAAKEAAQNGARNGAAAEPPSDAAQVGALRERVVAALKHIGLDAKHVPQALSELFGVERFQELAVVQAQEFVARLDRMTALYDVILPHVPAGHSAAAFLTGVLEASNAGSNLLLAPIEVWERWAADLTAGGQSA